MLKRIFDILFSIFAIIVTLPVFIIIGIIIKLTDGGNIFYGHTRIGKNCKPFKVFKFRSMYMDADKKLEEMLKNNPELKEEWEKTFKLKNDPRITPIGKFIRKTSLDELPQFFNVILGDMSVVGPRPVVQKELDMYYKDKTKMYCSVKPGVTGYWQVEVRSDADDYDERIQMDEWYINNQSLWLDIKIILKTIKVVLTAKGAY